jgi:phage tail sheath protein FI
MPVNPTAPGVYVAEVASGVRTIVGVSTSIACFVGRTLFGPIDQPIRVQSYTEFVRAFGDDGSLSDLGRYVRLFFLNGGNDCYVVRIADGATSSEITLRGENASPALRLIARNAGVLGDTIRIQVSYNTGFPEATFNLTLFRSVIDARGQRTQSDREVWNNLSMDPLASNAAATVLTQKSKLVSAIDVSATAPVNGSSLSGYPIEFLSTAPDETALRGKVAALLGSGSATTPKARSFRIAVDGAPPALVTIADDLGVAATVAGTTIPTFRTNLIAYLKGKIEAALRPGLKVAVSFDDVALPSPGAGQPDRALFLRIASAAATNTGSVYITQASSEDAALPLMLGQANGGTEYGPYAARRPAPSGVTLNNPVPFSVISQDPGPVPPPTELTSITLDRLAPDGSVVALPPISLTGIANSPPNGRNYVDAAGGMRGVREKLSRIRDAINSFETTSASTARWKAELWGSRLAIVPTGGDDNAIPPFATAPPATNLATQSTNSPRYYALGTSGTTGPAAFQGGGVAGSDGGPPKAADYDDAYTAIDNNVDVFNLLVLPPDRAPAPGASLPLLYGPASAFCLRRRAFLIMDPPDAWGDAQTAAAGVDALRIGLVKDYSAVYFPRLRVPEDGREVVVGPAGAMAGLYARIDASRGVWKAPAGTEADLRGVVGVDLRMSDGQDGIINPVGINGVRVFPDGVVSWGARTNDGADAFASEYKYVPIRRLALFIEESLYRGLKWVVFEPNDAPLWAQIRLNVGSFMHNLFRQGAFQGSRPQEAYFVKCDGETTTQADRDLGIVNIWVGFAPLKPAEFVILYLQQIAGQLAT